ncbi:hypothetical protein L3V79_02855 [Thiotrichales bacterium 19S9-12]|nr:hypothetical protein [Thiotrichales bacterium 19S9-11]MCF6811298.1 hypothetical protein [Thiotrichales bacterium 19S9-12]
MPISQVVINGVSYQLIEELDELYFDRLGLSKNFFLAKNDDGKEFIIKSEPVEADLAIKRDQALIFNLAPYAKGQEAKSDCYYSLYPYAEPLHVYLKKPRQNKEKQKVLLSILLGYRQLHKKGYIQNTNPLIYRNAYLNTLVYVSDSQIRSCFINFEYTEKISRLRIMPEVQLRIIENIKKYIEKDIDGYEKTKFQWLVEEAFEQYIQDYVKELQNKEIRALDQYFELEIRSSIDEMIFELIRKIWPDKINSISDPVLCEFFVSDYIEYRDINRIIDFFNGDKYLENKDFQLIKIKQDLLNILKVSRSKTSDEIKMKFMYRMVAELTYHDFSMKDLKQLTLQLIRIITHQTSGCSMGRSGYYSRETTAYKSIESKFKKIQNALGITKEDEDSIIQSTEVELNNQYHLKTYRQIKLEINQANDSSRPASIFKQYEQENTQKETDITRQIN